MVVAIASISSGNNSCKEETGPHWAVSKSDEYDDLFGCDQATVPCYRLGIRTITITGSADPHYLGDYA